MRCGTIVGLVLVRGPSIVATSSEQNFLENGAVTCPPRPFVLVGNLPIKTLQAVAETGMQRKFGNLLPGPSYEGRESTLKVQQSSPAEQSTPNDHPPSSTHP